MMKYALLLFLLLAAGCQTAPASVATVPTTIPFPTMTLGYVLSAPLPSPAPPNSEGASNPATALALANRPTATPNYALCPPVTAALPIGDSPRDGQALETALLERASGGAAAVETALREWGLLGATGGVSGDIDLTGEGVPDLIARYIAPGEGGALAIFVCAEGGYTPRYEFVLGGDAPSLVNAADMTADGITELLFTTQRCTNTDDPDQPLCDYVTQLIRWDGGRGRFVNLMEAPLRSDSPPTVEDWDSDRIGEILVRLEDDGNAEIGPLRTGFVVYDWNGVIYTQSITQLNPPTFRVQAVHLADSAFEAGSAIEAESLYGLVLDEPTLENWQNDDATVLRAYALYRLLISYAGREDARALDIYNRLLTDYPDPAVDPVYIAMARTFWNALQATNNLRSACIEVGGIITLRPEALTLLNRYGSRSPIYEAADLCPL